MSVLKDKIFVYGLSLLLAVIFVYGLSLLLAVIRISFICAIGGCVNFYINDKLDKNDPKKTSNGKAFSTGVRYTVAILIVGPICLYIYKNKRI